jgi:hypothetical protein
MSTQEERRTDDKLVNLQLLHGVGGCCFLFGLHSMNFVRQVCRIMHKSLTIAS